MKLTRRHQWGLGLALIVCANLFVLAGVAWNRSGEPDSVLSLTERELRSAGYVPYAERIEGDRRRAENNAVRFRLTLGEEYKVEKCQAYYYSGNDYVVPEQKMAEMGFSPFEKDGEFLERDENKAALIVLELSGPIYQRQREKAEAVWEAATVAMQEGCTEKIDCDCVIWEANTREVLRKLQHEESRLYVADVGIDRDALRAAYPDRQRYAIVQGLIKPSRYSAPDKAGTAVYPSWPEGRITELLVNEITVPVEWHSEGLYKRNSRFNAEVAFGQRLEPWITRLQLVEKNDQQEGGAEGVPEAK